MKLEVPICVARLARYASSVTGVMALKLLTEHDYALSQSILGTMAFNEAEEVSTSLIAVLRRNGQILDFLQLLFKKDVAAAGMPVTIMA